MALYEFDGKRPRVPDDSFVHPQAALIGDIEVVNSGDTTLNYLDLGEEII